MSGAYRRCGSRTTGGGRGTKLKERGFVDMDIEVGDERDLVIRPASEVLIFVERTPVF